MVDRPELAARLDVINAVGGGDGPLQRRGDEAAHQVRAGAHIDGGDGHRRVVAARVLPDDERADRLEPGDQDDQVDHQREHGPADEEIGEGLHGRRLGAQLSDGRGRQVVLRRQVVVLDHGHAVAQLEDAGADDALARLEARFHAHKVAARAARSG